MDFSLGLTTSMPVKHGVKLAKQAKERGFSRVFVGEDILSREVFTYLSIVAEESGMPVASGITSPYVRSLVLMVSASEGLQRCTENRFTLGIGPGGIEEVKKLTGKPPQRPVEVLKETAEVVRRIFRGEKVSYEGRKACLRGYQLRLKDLVAPKIYFGVRGPRLLELAGEVADGVIFSGPRSYLGEALERVESSARAGGRSPGEVKKVLWNPVALGESHRVRVIVATMLVSSPSPMLEEAGLREEAERIREKLKHSDYDQAARLVSSRAIEEFCIAGESIGDIKARLEEMEARGFQEFIFTPLGREMEEWQWTSE